jgi:predicted metal-dependent phosphoesterase TrpH
MKKNLLILLLVSICFSSAEAQKKIPHSHRTCNEIANRRTEIILPQVKGFNCYKADFHIHTTYSDGAASTTGRVDEAWYDGLDIIAITDHYESNSGVKKFFKVTAPYNSDGKPTEYVVPGSTKMTNDGVDPGIKIDFNAIHNEALWAKARRGYDMLIVKGCEMARNNEKLGHFNALFVEDLNSIYNFDIKEAFRNVKKQGGIIIHNHPGNIESNNPEWHAEVRKEGLIDGYEVANGLTFYPHILNRCIKDKFIMLGNTDIHGFTSHRYGTTGNLRTMTIVLAKELTEKAIKEALLKRRTIVYSGGELIGEEKWLSEFVNASVDCRLASTTGGKKGNTHIYTLINKSSITLRLRRGKTIYVLEPFKSTTIGYNPNKNGEYGTPKFTIDNMWHVDYKHPVVELKIDKK